MSSEPQPLSASPFGRLPGAAASDERVAARPRQRRAADRASSSSSSSLPAFRNPALDAARRSGGARCRRRPARARVHDRLLRRDARSSFRAATSASSRSTAPSTISRWAARARSRCRSRSSSRRGCRSPTSSASSRRCAPRPRAPASPIVTGDTKVVDRGNGDEIFINTSGIGVVPAGVDASARAHVRPGDAILLSGTIGDHGIAILAAREGLELGGDLAQRHRAAARAGGGAARRLPGRPRDARPDPRRPRGDARRDRVARASWASRSTRRAIPVRDAVRGACELLGLDPLLRRQRGQARRVRAGRQPPAQCSPRMRAHPLGRDAARDRDRHR